MPEVEEADEVAVDDGGDAAFQREPEKKRRPRVEMKARTEKNQLRNASTRQNHPNHPKTYQRLERYHHQSING